MRTTIANTLRNDTPDFLFSEKSFNLTLSALVTGINSIGKEFEEDTEISLISSEQAVFLLKSKLTIGTNIFLSISIPRTLFLEYHYNLLLSGQVNLITNDMEVEKGQKINIRLNRSFKIQPVHSKI